MMIDPAAAQHDEAGALAALQSRLGLTEAQRQEGYSIEAQREALTA